MDKPQCPECLGYEVRIALTQPVTVCFDGPGIYHVVDIEDLPSRIEPGDLAFCSGCTWEGEAGDLLGWAV